MNTLTNFFQTLFSFAIIIPLSLFCLFTVKKSIKIPDFKDSNALFVFIFHTRFSLVNCDDGF